MSQSSLPSTPVELKYPQCERGIGKVIRTVDSPDVIDGITLTPNKIWPDDRGYFLEVVRLGTETHDRNMQVSATLSYPGTIKAFHYHLFQDDIWVPVQGMFQVALVDLRATSVTFGLRNTIYIGDLQPWTLKIPVGVGHGYKVVTPGPGMLVYVTNQFYDPKDEGRIAHDDNRLNYDWETQYK